MPILVIPLTSVRKNKLYIAVGIPVVSWEHGQNTLFGAGHNPVKVQPLVEFGQINAVRQNRPAFLPRNMLFIRSQTASARRPARRRMGKQ